MFNLLYLKNSRFFQNKFSGKFLNEKTRHENFYLLEGANIDEIIRTYLYLINLCFIFILFDSFYFISMGLLKKNTNPPQLLISLLISH